MKKKLILFISSLLIILILCCFFIFRFTQKDLVYEIAAQFGTGMEDSIEKQSITEYFPFTFSDENGNTITIYICQTLYLEDDIQVTGINFDAVSSVFDTENPVLHKEFGAYGHPAAIYQGENHSYLCWTTSPNISGVLEYNTGTISEDDLIKIAKSVYKFPEEEKNDSQN